MDTLNLNELQTLIARQQRMLRENEALLSRARNHQSSDNDSSMFQSNNLNMLRQAQPQQQQQQPQEQRSSLMDVFNNRTEFDAEAEPKRIRELEIEVPAAKRQRVEIEAPLLEEPGQHLESVEELLNKSPETEPAPVAASGEGLAFFNDNDVLSGRGGGTNVHPGNRTFRDLINLHRRSYLKARKNDKPAISRAIVRVIREQNGRFLKREEKSNLWFEIGDDAAREKTSQALRQRAPEMRKILFESEREQARHQLEELQKNQQSLLYPGTAPVGQMNLGSFVPMPNVPNKNSFSETNDFDQMRQNLMTAALLGGGINRITPHGA
jgi:hypothetical protein|mmetsp:Transcript_10166/g.12218  ORF Transcript_10166/g.12218 Transcript_10166/m.12218 type:complete len:324 (-) Transcript_10166:138-1109(-)